MTWQGLDYPVQALLPLPVRHYLRCFYGLCLFRAGDTSRRSLLLLLSVFLFYLYIYIYNYTSPRRAVFRSQYSIDARDRSNSDLFSAPL